jgi:hypothetical protein
MDVESAPPLIPDDERTDLDELKRRLRSYRQIVASRREIEESWALLATLPAGTHCVG